MLVWFGAGAGTMVPAHPPVSCTRSATAACPQAHDQLVDSGHGIIVLLAATLDIASSQHYLSYK